MSKQLIFTEHAPRPSGAYSQALRAGNFIYTAGMMAINPDTNQLIGGNIEEQTARALDNLQMILEQAGASFADVVKATVHLSDLSLFPGFNQVYAGYFPDPKPVRTTVGCQLLLGALVEIDLVAYIGA